jgi:hypothetical protein
MKSIHLIILFLITFSITSNAQVTKKTLELPEFKSIYVNSSYTVYLKQTNKQEVTVEALTEIYELTTIKVENGVLMINVERKPDNTSKSVWSKIDDIKINPTMKLMVSVKSINELQVNGGGKIISENSIASDYMSLAVAGSGNIELDIKGNNLKTEIGGSGNIILKGYASTNDIQLSGSGSAELSVTASLDAIVMGSGSVKHKGNTKSVTKKVYGSGLIDRAY